MYRDTIVQLYSKYAKQFDQKIGVLDLYNKSYIDFVDHAKSKCNLLDLACGPGNVSSFIKKLVPDIAITCVDLSVEMLELAKAKLVSGNFYKADILNITIPAGKYDMIICAFGLPYITNAEIRQFVSEIHRFAHDDTIIYISCMQGENPAVDEMSFAQNEKVLVHFHNKKTVADTFRMGGFTLLNYKEQEYLEQNGTVTIDMIFRFGKNQK